MHKVVCTCEATWPAYQSYWQDQNDFIFMGDRVPLDVHYNEANIRETFNFKGDVSKNHFWNSQGNRNIIWFYAHFRMVYYYMLNPNEDWYWFFDDDVVIDDWQAFFKGFENDTTDFIAYYLFKEASVKSQPLVPNIDDRTASGNGWFNRFPGDGDLISRELEMFGSFFPIVRFSNRSLKLLAEMLLNGEHGYSEGFVPTILNAHGHTLASIYNQDSKSIYYGDHVNVLHKNIKTTWSWI